VNALKITGGGVKINTFFEEFLIKGDKAYRLYQAKLDVHGVKQLGYQGGDVWKVIRDFVKDNLLPVIGFKYHEILVTTKADNEGEVYTHAGAFVRRVTKSRGKSGQRVEVYYFDSNLNHLLSIGGQTIPSEPMDFEQVFRQYEIVKIYALAARNLPYKTEKQRQAIVLEHLRIGKNFIERPEEAIWQHYVHLAKIEGQKTTAKALA
jgi:hypothetical protein